MPKLYYIYGHSTKSTDHEITLQSKDWLKKQLTWSSENLLSHSLWCCRYVWILFESFHLPKLCCSSTDCAHLRWVLDWLLSTALALHSVGGGVEAALQIEWSWNVSLHSVGGGVEALCTALSGCRTLSADRAVHRVEMCPMSQLMTSDFFFI